MKPVANHRHKIHDAVKSNLFIIWYRTNIYNAANESRSVLIVLHISKNNYMIVTFNISSIISRQTLTRAHVRDDYRH